MATEVIFLVEEAPEGRFTARALGYSIFTEADKWDELREPVRDAVNCHFEQEKMPPVIRIDYVREEVLARCGCSATEAQQLSSWGDLEAV